MFVPKTKGLIQGYKIAFAVGEKLVAAEIFVKRRFRHKYFRQSPLYYLFSKSVRGAVGARFPLP
jgi:hypothetical protein